MSKTKLCLLLLLSSCAVAQQGGENAESANLACSKEASRFKPLRKYVYNYEIETSNGIPGTADSQSGVKINCKAEVEVPQICSFILRTNQCTLREVYGVNTDGKVMLKKAKNSDDFSTAMSQFELKFTSLNGKEANLYPEKNEPVNILNIKKGIISAIMVPPEIDGEEETVFMDTVYGKCSSKVTVNTREGNTATGIATDRDLSSCDHFYPVRDYVSPVALITGLNTPLSTLISSSQSCSYKVDQQRRHVLEAVCDEKHIFLPFSHKNQHGIMAQVKQSLKLDNQQKTNSRDFYIDESMKESLFLKPADVKLSQKSGDNVLKTLQELMKLSVSQQNIQRASLFQKFVTGLRSLKNESLTAVLPKLMETSSSITLQALPQCGTPECYGGILQVLRDESVSPLLADAVTYAMGLMPSPCTKRVREVLTMAQYLQSRPTFYALSHAIRKFYDEKNVVTQELKDASDFMASLIGSDCSGDEDKTYLTLKAIGNMGKAMEAANSKLKTSLLKCIRNPSASLSVQKAAIHAFRQMTLTDEVRGILLQTFQDGQNPVEKRLAAYLMLMKKPSSSDVSKVTRALVKEKNEQVKSFVASHVANILESKDPAVQELKERVEVALKGGQVPSVMDFRKFSRNYQISRSVSLPTVKDPFAATIEGNLIFDPSGYMPREAMLETTLKIFGYSVDMFELGMDGHGFEPTIEALFGQEGFFPNSALKALYWVDGKVPEAVSNVLHNWFEFSKNKEPKQDLLKELMPHVQKLMDNIKSHETPEAKAYLKILGTELGFLKLSDFKLLGEIVLRNVEKLKNVPRKIFEDILKGTDSDLFAHYIFMDNEFNLPTGAGLQLKFSLSGTMTPGAKVGLKVQPHNMLGEVSLNPAVSVDFATHMGIHIPEFTQNGVEMNTNLYHESGIEVHGAIKEGKLKISFPAPRSPTKLFSISNKLSLLSTTKSEVIPPLIENRQSWTSCKPFFTGLNYCTSVLYSNASSTDAAPYYPLTGETSFDFELQPTGEVKEYSATVSYEPQKEGHDMVDTLKVVVQAEGVKDAEATITFKYNRNRLAISSDVQIPNFDVDYGIRFGVNDDSTPKKTAYTISLNATNKNIPEVILLGHTRYNKKGETLLQGLFSVPHLNIEAKAETLVRSDSNALTIQLDASSVVYQSKAAQQYSLKYDSKKVAVEWNSGVQTDLKKLVSDTQDIFQHVDLPDMSEYPKALQKYADHILDQKVALADMTLRHTVAQSIVATNNWLQKKAKDIPYAATIQTQLSGIQELKLEKLGMPTISIPEQFFLGSNGSVKYTFNSDKLVIEVPVPFGGKTLKEMNFPDTIITPPLLIPSMGINVQSQAYTVPSFTIPETYQLHLPLLGVLEFSAGLHSNYYNWSAVFMGGNKTRDTTNFQLNYKVIADSALDLLSYSLEGTAVASYDQRKRVSYSYDGSLRHKFLDGKASFSESYELDDNFKGKALYEVTASSVLGVASSATFSGEVTKTNDKGIFQSTMDGQLKVASFEVKSSYKASYTVDYNNYVGKGESEMKLDSSCLVATNKISGNYDGEELSITSVTDVQNGALGNNLVLSYRNTELTLTSDTTGKYQSLTALNKINLRVTRQVTRIRSEYQADYYRSRYYTLISGTFDTNGLEINADVSANSELNRGAYKATLKISQDGLSTSSTAVLQYSPVVLKNEFNAAIGSSGATMKISADGQMQQHHAKVMLDGTVATTGISINSVAQGTVYDFSGQNILIFKADKEGLVFSNNLLGSHSEKKIEYNNELKIPGWSLQFTSKLDSALDSSRSYKQNFDLGIQLYSLTANLNNNFKYNTVTINNRGQLQLEPFKLNLNGDMGGAYGKNEIKHTYTIKYADLTTTATTDTTSKLPGIKASNRASLEIAGLAAKFSSDTRFDSISMKFTNVLRTAAEPFTFTIDALTDGDLNLYVLGHQYGNVYSKLLLKAEPLAFTLSHAYRGAIIHNPGDERSVSTVLDSKVNALFNPSEQSSSWKIKTELNKNTYNQELSAYNDAEKVGLVLSGQASVDLTMMDSPITIPLMSSEPFNLIDIMDLRDVVAQPQEFSISGTIQYDKNKDVHVINLPFIENLPACFEQIKGAILSTLESIQSFLKKADVDKYVRKYKAALDKLPQQMNDYVNELDLETKVKEVKTKLVDFTKDYRITTEELQNMLEKSTLLYKEALTQLQIHLTKLQQYLTDVYDYYELRPAIEKLIKQIIEHLKELDQQYEISQTAIETINSIQNTILQYDINKLKSSTAAWVQNIDAKYQIKAQLQEKLEQLKVQIQNLDAQKIGNNINEYLQSINIQEYIEKIKMSVPTEKIYEVINRIRVIIINLMEEYEVAEKINALYAKMQELIVRYDVDKQIQILLDKTVQLASQYQIKETAQAFMTSLKSSSVKVNIDNMIRVLDDAITQLREYDYKQFIDQVNDFLDMIIKELRSFDYNAFVDRTNNKIQELRQKVNNQIKALDLPQKVEAMKGYVRDVKATALFYTEQLKDTKLAEMIDWLRNLINSITIDDLKIRIQENLEDLRDRIYLIDLQREIQWYLQQAEQVYKRIVNYISEQWDTAAKKITTLAKQYNAIDWAYKIQTFVEEGFVVPEIRFSLIYVPEFEVSLRALRKAEFDTPEFTVPLTDLVIPSVHVNLNNLKSITVPMKFTTPAFTIFNTYKVPSFTIDLNEIKQSIIRTIDKIHFSEFHLPTPELYFKDFKLRDLPFSDISFPEINLEQLSLSDLQMPAITIPKLNLENFQLPDIQIPDFKLPRIPHTVTMPTFGKLHGTFKIASPFYTLTSTGLIQNATTIQKSPIFKASVSAQATSKAEILEFTLDANARLSAPEMAQLVFVEDVKLNHKSIMFDHDSRITFSSSSLLGSAKTAVKTNTVMYIADATNTLSFKLQRGISIETQTTYNHALNIAQHDLTSQLSIQNNIQTSIEAGKISVTVSNTGNGKWSCPMFSDEGKHDSRILFNLDGSVATIKFSGDTGTKYLTMKQNVNFESGLLSFVALNMQAETESPYVGSSILTVKGRGALEEMKTEVEVSHIANLAGRATGKITNSITFMTQPFEMKFSSNNNGNIKIVFPKELTSKIDFLNNYGLILNSGIQEVTWQASARFNQYKYAHKMYLGNNEDSIGANLEMNGAANLDFLNIPVDIPELAVPYTTYKTPKVVEFSLWERTGLKNLLKTTRQSFDLNLKIQYKKNKDSHSITLPLEPIYKIINTNVRSFGNNFEKGRDKTLNFLTESYNQAKTRFDKFKVDTSVNKQPRTFRIPGYTIPVLNIEVSPFSAELPAFGYFIPKEVSTPSFTLPVVGFSIPSYTLVLPSLELPVLHVPNTLRKLSLPKFKLPKLQNAIMVPAMGNITYDFALKSSVISLTANAGLYNQSDIVARFGASSASTFDVLSFTLEGTTSLTRKTGLKLATALSLNHKYIQAKHNSSVSLTKSTTDASVTTTAKVSSPVLTINFKQELKGNPTSKPNVKSLITCDYDFAMPEYKTNFNGKAEHSLTLEGLTSYFSLESSANGDISGTLLSNRFSGKLNKEANTYLNSKGARSNVKLSLNSRADGSTGNTWNLELVEDLALEASTQRMYAVWKHNSENMAKIEPLLNTNGKQKCKATLEIVPWSLVANIDAQINQPSDYLKNANTHQTVSLNINPESHKFDYSGKIQIKTVILSQDIKVTNDKTEVRCELAGALQGHMNCLKSIVLPVYKKSIWDILKFDLTTSEDKLQYLNSSAIVVYKKNKDGYFFPLPVKVLSDGITINIPAITLQVPEWIKDLPNKARDFMLPNSENFKIADKFTFPSVITTPQFNVPFTTLSLPAYTIDLTKIKIPKKISTLPFDLNLPALPKVRFSKVDIGARYKMNEEYKIPYFEVSIPKSGFTISDFTLPKTISIGSYTWQLDNLANQIADFDLPTVSIPEQKVEIPPLMTSWPAGLFIPTFGALSGSIKIASPIYNATWTTTLSNETNSVVTSVVATCSSTLQFLEYDIDAKTITTLEDGILNLKGICTVSHRDLSMEWNEVFMLQGLSIPHNTLKVDIVSPTFADVSIRCDQGSNSISASLSSPAAGFLGLLLDKSNPRVLSGKLYRRSTSSSEEEDIIMQGDISLKNPEEIQIRANWNGDTTATMLKGLKDRVPKMTNAVYSCINKYHREHFGMGINTASLKLKDALQNKIEDTYELANTKIEEVEYKLRTAATSATQKYENMKETYQKLYKNAADQASSIDFQQVTADFFDTAIELVRAYQKKARDLIDAVINFVKVTKFQLPGFDKKYTGEEFYDMMTKQIPMAIDQLIQKIHNFLKQYSDSVVKFISGLKIKLPGSDKTLYGTELLDQIKVILRDIEIRIHEGLALLPRFRLENMLQQLKEYIQYCFERTEEVFKALKEKNLEAVQVQFQQMYKDAANSQFGEKMKSIADSFREIISQFHEKAQKELLIQLDQASIYVKALREEYLDANMVGWTVKYYEIEDKVTQLMQALIDYLKEMGPKYLEQTTEFVSRLTTEIKNLYEKYGTEYYNYATDLLTDFEGRGRQKILELSQFVQKEAQQWAENAKNNAAMYKEQANIKLQAIYTQFFDSYEKFITEVKRLIDLSIEKCNAFFKFIMELLQRLQTKTSETLQVRVNRNELMMNLHHPFEWNSFDEMPHLSKMDFINHVMIQQGIEKGSKIWEELHIVIQQQLADGKASIEQIIETIQKHINN